MMITPAPVPNQETTQEQCALKECCQLSCVAYDTSVSVTDRIVRQMLLETTNARSCFRVPRPHEDPSSECRDCPQGPTVT